MFNILDKTENFRRIIVICFWVHFFYPDTVYFRYATRRNYAECDKIYEYDAT